MNELPVRMTNELLLIISVTGMLALPAYFLLEIANGISRKNAIGYTFLLMIVGMTSSFGVWYGKASVDFVRLIAACYVPLVGIPFLILLFQKWAGKKQQPYGNMMECLADWYSVPMLAGVGSIGFAASIAFVHPVINCMAIGLGLLALYPLYFSMVRPASLSPSLALADAEAPATEQLYILQMVESGKISASEGADLLGALAVVENKSQINADNLLFLRAESSFWMQLLGLMVMIASYFMTWIRVEDPMGEAMKMLTSLYSPEIVRDMVMGSTVRFQKVVLTINGFQINYAVTALIIMVICAVVTFLGRIISDVSRRIIQALSIAACGCIFLIIFGKVGSSLSWGALFALGGLAIQTIGVIGQWKKSGLAR